MTSDRTHTYKRMDVTPSKVGASKVYDYIRKIEVDGIPRIRAYAECIDPKIYELTPQQINNKLEYFKNAYPAYKEIREMVLAEQKDWALRKSNALQNKALDLLSNLIDKANAIATDPEADAKDLNIAVSTLKSIMPAFGAVGNQSRQETNTTDKKVRASKFIS